MKIRSDGYVRMFMMPGVLHCGGGAGPDKTDWAAAIDAWVDGGKAPERIVARKVSNDLLSLFSTRLRAGSGGRPPAFEGGTDHVATIIEARRDSPR
jgi:hypothetical protein